MSRDTKIRLALAVLVFMMVQAVVFGIGMLLVLTPTSDNIGQSHFNWIWGMTAASFIIAAPISWWIAPHLRARFSRKRDKSSVISSVS